MKELKHQFKDPSYNMAWLKFVQSGKIEDYLKFKNIENDYRSND